jgi:hypothetical protein
MSVVENIEDNNLEDNNTEPDDQTDSKSIITITGKPYKKKSTFEGAMPLTPKPCWAFEKKCDHCNKVIKSAKSYDNHINTQVCYTRDELTYCKLCKLTVSNHNEYLKHLLSMEHINKIGCNNLEVLHNNQPSTILQADPYLTNNEARSIGTNNLGNKFTFVFENNNTQTVNLIPNTDSSTLQNDTKPEKIGKKIGEKIIEPTQKQMKILSLLNNISNVAEGCKILLLMLDNKLNIEDYNGLQNIIKKDTNMKPEYKSAYSEIIDKFVSMLIKRKNNGEIIYKDKDISKIVISLTI